MRIHTSKVRLVKSSFGGLRSPFDGAIFIFYVSSRIYKSLVSLTKIYNFSRKSLSKYLMDTIDIQ